MINNDLLQYLCCPKCKSDLVKQDNFLICGKCREKYKIMDDNIVKIIPNMTPDLELSIQKWDEFYQKRLIDKSYLREKNNYLRNYFEDTYQQLNEYKKLDKDLVYLEIGCGPMFLGQEIVNQCKLVIGIDFCPSALKIAKKMLEAKGMKNYLLIQGNILNMPIKNNKIDLIYGGGVIEHFKDTQRCIDELYRVLKWEGVSFNTVPYLNIGSLTYRQIWGNIPNFPILKQITEFIHIKLLKGKHMIFGYELSFLSSTLKKIHKKAGFKNIHIGRFKVKLAFDFIYLKFLRKICIYTASNNRLFWPMIKVIAKK